MIELLELIIKKLLRGVLIFFVSLNSFASDPYEIEGMLDEFGCRAVCDHPKNVCVGYLPRVQLDDASDSLVWEEKLGECKPKEEVKD
jgi:hypothetical protein